MHVSALLVAVNLLAAVPAHADPGSPGTDDLSLSSSAGDPGECAAADRPTGFRPHAMLLGGVAGLGGDGRHPFGGAEIGGFYGRFGALVLGQLGDGNGYRSILFAGGPAAELYDAGIASFAAYAGVAWYEEEQEVGFARDVTGPYAGLTARIPLPVGAIGVTFSLWRGTLDGEAFEQSTTVTGHRLSVGFGW